MKEKLIKESEVDKLTERLQMALDRHTASSPMVDMSMYEKGLSFAIQVVKKEYRDWKTEQGQKYSYDAKCVLGDKKTSHAN